MWCANRWLLRYSLRALNQIFRFHIYEYKNIVYGLELYIKSIDERIIELMPHNELNKEKYCFCKNS